MDSFGIRFSESNYIKVDIDFPSGNNEVTLLTEVEGEQIVATGSIVWGDGE